jgi:hypothetical protein
MTTKILLNDFATRCFRDTADQDYISARLSYRAGLIPQFHWQALQALEKYLKAILLYNRIKANNINHCLGTALDHCEKLPFQMIFSESTEEFMQHLDAFGRFRYLEQSYFIHGPKLLQLDKAVWEIRRFCKVMNYDMPLGDGKIRNMLEGELAIIKQSENLSPQKFRIIGGLLEKIVDNKRHCARSALIWQNGFFGKSIRKMAKPYEYFHATNAPLTLHPEVLDDVLEYVFLPKYVIDAYRKELEKRRAKEPAAAAPP